MRLLHVGCAFSVQCLSLLSFPGVIVDGFVHQHSTVVSPPQRTVATTTALYSNTEDDDEQRRMELVRNLQSMYYSSENGDAPELDPTTGIMTNLPLWRVPWTELPGRTNILNVHEPMYTNMFETILNRKGSPSYFGHLYLPGGSKSLRSNEVPYQLKSWQDEAKYVDPPDSRTAVVGTLMKIVDYRRMQDGRLCLLVHAMERFVVQDAIQNLPYSMAHVQMLPDSDDDSSTTSDDRAKAVVESFRYHDYEYNEIPLPLPTDVQYMSQAEVYGSHLASVLPFASYKLMDESVLPDNKPAAAAGDATTSQEETEATVELSLEDRLMNSEILKPPTMHPKVILSRGNQQMTNDELEKRIWSAMEDLCAAKNISLPPEVTCLLPPDCSSFRNSVISTRRVAPAYPASRRHSRLSFAASAILEATEAGIDMRQEWLQAPSTNDRLADLLERYEMLNAKVLGEFQ